MANPYFDAAYYLAHNSDLVKAGITAATAEWHYDTYGAGEGRAPNAWFDANAYLLANTDLIANGVTMATALAHFANYGVNEGRIFNNNPALQPGNFSAKAYADLNADVAAAFGITDTSAITPEQANQLLGHFLAYGLPENRDAGAANAAFVAAAVATITVAEGVVTVGTSGNDSFVWNVDAITGTHAAHDAVSVNGLDGTDTLTINGNAAGADNQSLVVNVASVENVAFKGDVDDLAGGATSHLQVNGTGVQSLTIDNDDAAVAFVYAGAKVNTLNLVDGAATLNFAAASVAGTADALAVTVGKEAGNLIVNGIEQVSVAVAAGATTANITDNGVAGDSLVFNVSGGKAGTGTALTVESTGSASLGSATVDGSAFVGNLTVNIGTALAGVKAINVTTGSGDDVLNATTAVDTLTGNAGADTFTFAVADNALMALSSTGKIEGVDTITDFSTSTASTDVFTFTGVTAGGASSAIKIGADTIANTDANSVVTFDTGFLAGKDLTAIVTALSSSDLADTEGVIFDFGGSTYVFVSDGVTTGITGDSLVQLTGGVSAADLAVGANAITFA
ncbi:beta strand repeat-containing protein [Castellaniella hirudinis]|uniref:beta strand repeat-containing protein n=1 Tax=Castellaniella hirudinis TaxID=1144617 RepID=UPI0039C29C73